MIDEAREHPWLKTCFTTILACGLLWGQEPTASLSGIVSGENGNALRAAEIKVTHLNTGRIWKLLTGSQGSYLASGLPSGSYVVEISASGYQTTVSGRQLAEGEDATSDFVLRFAADREKAPLSEPPAVEEPAVELPTVPESRAPIPVPMRKLSSPPEPSPRTEPMGPSPAPDPTAEKRAEGNGFQIQVAAFRERIPAETLKTLLAGAGYPAHVTEVDLPSGRHFRVRVGPFSRAELAEQTGSELKQLFPKQIAGLWITR